jgi:hypothetical protein
MAKFQISIEKKNDRALVALSGSIDEDSIFTHKNILDAKEMEVDFKNVDSINSCGVREWFKWLDKIPLEMPIKYFNCPKFIVDQVNMVAGLLRKGITVHSFYVPYYCEKCNQETSILFTSGKEFVGTKVNAPEDVKCSKCQGPTELDVMEASYFKFLQRQG